MLDTHTHTHTHCRSCCSKVRSSLQSRWKFRFYSNSRHGKSPTPHCARFPSHELQIRLQATIDTSDMSPLLSERAIDRMVQKNTPRATFGTSPRLPLIERSSNVVASYQGLSSPKPRVKQSFARARRFSKERAQPRVPLAHCRDVSSFRGKNGTFGREARTTNIPVFASVTSNGLMPLSSSAPETRVASPQLTPTPPTTAPTSRLSSRTPSACSLKTVSSVSGKPQGWDLVRRIVKSTQRLAPLSESTLENKVPPAMQKARDELHHRARRIRVTREDMVSDEVCDLSQLRNQVLRDLVPLVIDSVLRRG